jgi:hypothetical protein
MRASSLDTGRTILEITPEAINDPTGINPETSQRFRADGFTSNNGIFLARSDDGGSTWGTPVAVTSNLYDGVTPVPYEIMPDLAIDTNPSSPNYGNAGLADGVGLGARALGLI